MRERGVMEERKKGVGGGRKEVEGDDYDSGFLFFFGREEVMV